VNFLAHFLLAHPTSASRAGNFLGDFITGTPESLKDTIPADVLDGIMMHRKIDVFTDSHPAFGKGKSLLAPERRRFAGIILDVFTDHFLAKHWNRYSEVPLLTFNKEVFQNLQDHWQIMPTGAQKVARWMYEQNWFQIYTTPEGIERSLRGLSKRRPKFDPIEDGIVDFHEHYETYQKLSFQLLDDALKQKWNLTALERR